MTIDDVDIHQDDVRFVEENAKQLDPKTVIITRKVGDDVKHITAGQILGIPDDLPKREVPQYSQWVQTA